MPTRTRQQAGEPCLMRCARASPIRASVGPVRYPGVVLDGEPTLEPATLAVVVEQTPC
jgi:hypothetical protein